MAIPRGPLDQSSLLPARNAFAPASRSGDYRGGPGPMGQNVYAPAAAPRADARPSQQAPVQRSQNAAAPAQAPIDYSNDPIRAQIALLGQGSIPAALASADAARIQLLTQFGSADLARQTRFGGRGFSTPGIAGGPGFSVPDTSRLGDESTALAAQGNPFSTLARMAHGHEQQNLDIDATRARQNLLFSSTRANDLGEESRGYQQSQADAYAAMRAALGEIDTGVEGAYQAESERQMRAEQEAYLRALAEAAARPPAPADYGAPEEQPLAASGSLQDVAAFMETPAFDPGFLASLAVGAGAPAPAKKKQTATFSYGSGRRY